MINMLVNYLRVFHCAIRFITTAFPLQSQWETRPQCDIRFITTVTIRGAGAPWLIRWWLWVGCPLAYRRRINVPGNLISPKNSTKNASRRNAMPVVEHTQTHNTFVTNSWLEMTAVDSSGMHENAETCMVWVGSPLSLLYLYLLVRDIIHASDGNLWPCFCTETRKCSCPWFCLQTKWELDWIRSFVMEAC